MIDPNVFRVSRAAARAKLDPDVARESFGYFIDVMNDWEAYRSPDELIFLLGIHQTHESQFPEILNDVGTLSPAERDWARRYVRFYERVARLLTTSGRRAQLQFDLAETIFDWRTILKFVDLPARILDYGAGCGRQCVSSFLRNPGNVYVAVDSTLAAYTVQNLVFSLMDALGAPGPFVDFLDMETVTSATVPVRGFNKSSDFGAMEAAPSATEATIALAAPAIAGATRGSRFHVPAWFEAEALPARFFDVILACHVHNELSGSDFRRLIAAVDKGLSDDGIFYVRSELGVRFPKNYFDSLDMHAIDPIALLATKDIVPVYCTYAAAFQTTVFARKGSRHHAMALASPKREHHFNDIGSHWDATIRAGHHYVLDVLDWLAASGRRTAFCGPGGDMFGKLVAARIDSIPNRIVFTEQEAVAGEEPFMKAIAAFAPEVIVCADNFSVIEANVRRALGGEFKIRLQYAMPIVFLCREYQRELDPILRADIRTPDDVKRALGEPVLADTQDASNFLDR